MNYLSFVLFIIYLIILISLSFGEEFNPLPESNGQLNANYNHYKNQEDNLFFILLHFRHGARAPIYLDENQKDMFGGEWHNQGELTYLGRRQQYQIGLKNRERYSNFISEKYDPKEIKIYSTYYDRTINSVQSQLLGLYNNISYNDYNFRDFNNTNLNDNNIEYINTIIPPIQLFEKKNLYNKNIYEKTFKNHFNCPYIKEQVYKNMKESNEILDSLINKFHNEFYKILKKEYKGIKYINYKIPKRFYRFCDVYLSIYPDKNNNHVLNRLTKRGKNITKLKEICDDYFFNNFIYNKDGGYANNNALISQSSTMRQIIDWMEVRTEQNNNFTSKYSEPKFVLFSGHDSSLFEIQKILNICFNIELEYTPFASTQLFELRKYGNLFYVEIYYNDRLKMNITFEQFKKRIKKKLMSDQDIYNICYRKQSEIDLMYKKMILVFIIIILIVIIILISWKINKEKKSNAYEVLQIANIND